MIHRAVIIRVPLDVEGKPDLQLPASTIIQNEWPGRLWHLYWEDYYLTVLRLGTVGSDVVFAAVGCRRILVGLAHLGAAVTLFKDAWADAQQRQWLLNHGVTTGDLGAPRAPIVYTGDQPETLASDGE